MDMAYEKALSAIEVVQRYIGNAETCDYVSAIAKLEACKPIDFGDNAPLVFAAMEALKKARDEASYGYDPPHIVAELRARDLAKEILQEVATSLSTAKADIRKLSARPAPPAKRLSKQRV
jgi:hypothetical protein